MTTLTEACNIFKVLDDENNGYITVDKFIASFHHFYQNDDDDKIIQENTLKSLISKMEPDKDGKISLNSFLSVFQKIQPETSYDLKAKRYSQYSIKRFLSAESFESPEIDELRHNDDSKNQENILNCTISLHDDENEMNHDTKSFQSDNRLSKSQIRNTNLHESPKLMPSAASRVRDLFSAGASPRGSDINPGVLTQEIGNNFELLQMQMKRLEHKLNDLHSEQFDLDKKQSGRLKEENKTLVQRINNLEDSLRELEQSSQSRMMQETKDFKQKFVKAEEEKHRVLESMQNQLYRLEGESADLSLEIRRYRDESEKSRAEKHSLTERLTESDIRISNLQEEFEELRSQSKSDVEKLKKEKAQYERNLMDLNDKSESAKNEPQIRMQTMNKLSLRHKELEDLIQKLRDENNHLITQIESINNELIQKTSKDGSDMSGSSNSVTRDLDHCSKEELMDILAREKDSNFRLREYVEKIIIKVMERHPALLEVHSSKK